MCTLKTEFHAIFMFHEIFSYFCQLLRSVWKSVESGKVKRAGNWKFLSLKATHHSDALLGGELRRSLNTVWCVRWLRHAARLTPRQVTGAQTPGLESEHQWPSHWLHCVPVFHNSILQSQRRVLHAPDFPLSSPVTGCVTVSIPPLLRTSLGLMCAPGSALWAWSLPSLPSTQSNHFCVYDMR